MEKRKNPIDQLLSFKKKAPIKTKREIGGAFGIFRFIGMSEKQSARATLKLFKNKR